MPRNPRFCFHPAVLRPATFCKYWLPVILWAGVIFSASSDSGSGEQTSRLLGPLLRWLFPQLTPATVADLIFSIRKTAHVTEYALLALLFWRACRQPERNDRRPWNWSHARLTLGFTAFYAATDEFHQMFVPSREARLHDVALDICGAAAALLLLWGLGRVRKTW